MISIFEKLKRQWDKNLPFVIYNKPNSSELIGLFQQKNDLFLVNDFTEKGFVFAPFEGNSIVLIPENDSETIIEDWKPGNVSHYNKTYAPDFSAKNVHELLVTKAIEAIQEEQFQKVVLSRKEIADKPDLDWISVFEKVLNNFPNAFTYCWHHPKIGLWMGAFSERLLLVENQQFQTMALAGTQPFLGTEEVIWQEKEREEQEFVTDYIVNNLKYEVSEISVSNPYTIKAGNLLHIKTDISGNIGKNADLKQLISVLHPTPAVCGFPAQEAKKFILENENYDREFYSGYLGELNYNNKTDLFVNLRCVQIKNKQVHFYMGGGITKDSVPEKEWTETVNKSLTMKKMFLS